MVLQLIYKSSTTINSAHSPSKTAELKNRLHGTAEAGRKSGSCEELPSWPNGLPFFFFLPTPPKKPPNTSAARPGTCLRAKTPHTLPMEDDADFGD